MTKHPFLNKIKEQFKKEIEKDDNIIAADESGYILSHIPYGIPALPMIEIAMGRPGYPAGKLIELYGEPHCGKTTLAYHAMAATQRLNPDAFAVFIDTEQSWDEERAKQCGVDTDRVLLTAVKTIEGAIRALEKQFKLFRTLTERPPIICVLDSITGVTTEYEQDKEFTQEQRSGHEAKQIRAGIKKINTQLAELKIPLILVNHVIGNVPKGFGFQKPTQSAGGKAPKFFAAIRLEVKRVGDRTKKHKGYTIKIGQTTNFKLEKNKVNSPRLLNITDVNLTNDNGFDHIENLLEALYFVDAVEMVTKGKVYKYNDHEFHKDDWPKKMEELGGYDAMLNVMRSQAITTGWMRPYGLNLEE